MRVRFTCLLLFLLLLLVLLLMLLLLLPLSLSPLMTTIALLRQHKNPQNPQPTSPTQLALQRFYPHSQRGVQTLCCPYCAAPMRRQIITHQFVLPEDAPSPRP